MRLRINWIIEYSDGQDLQKHSLDNNKTYEINDETKTIIERALKSFCDNDDFAGSLGLRPRSIHQVIHNPYGGEKFWEFNLATVALPSEEWEAEKSAKHLLNELTKGLATFEIK